MITLALDIGVTTGWALSTHETGSLSLRHYSDHGEAVSVFEAWLSDTIVNNGVKRVIVEKIPPLSGRARSTASDLTKWLEGAAHGTACVHKIARSEMPAVTVRKTLIKQATKAKDESELAFDMKIMEAVKNHGFNPQNEHEADAAALLLASQMKGVRI